MKNSYKTFAFVLLASFLFTYCSTDKQRNRDIPYNDLETVMTNLSPLPQTFNIDPGEDNQLKGKKGTVVFIPAGAFQFEDGSTPRGVVQVELKESYTLTEMIGAGLHTMSGDSPLETAGMIYVNATADGKPLKIQDGKAFVVSFPKNQQTEEMDLFYSLALKDSVETWVVDYEVFGVESQLAAMKDTLRINGDTDLVYYTDKYSRQDILGVYPFELTPDLYEDVWTCNSVIIISTGSAITSPVNLITDFAESELNKYKITNDSIDEISVLFDFDSKGKIFNIRPKDGLNSKSYQALFSKVKNILENAPPVDTSVVNKYNKTCETCFLNFYKHTILNQDRYKQKFRNQYAQYQNKAIEKIDQAQLNYYTFAVTKLGWINCDRFLDMDASELTNFAVNTTSPNTSTVRLIFKDLNSILEGSYEDGKIVFANLPKGKAVKLVGISYADGKPTMATAETVVGEKGFELTGYKPFTLDEMEAALNN